MLKRKIFYQKNSIVNATLSDDENLLDLLIENSEIGNNEFKSDNMSISFLEKLKSQLKKDSKFVDDEGKLLENNIVNATLSDDENLLDLLIENSEICEHFFYKKNDLLIFQKEKFLDYIVEKNVFDNSFTKFKNKIGLNIGHKFLNERNEVSLVFPFKDCVLEAGMNTEEAKRGEIFFNEILAKDEIDKLFDKKVLTDFKVISSENNVDEIKFNRNEEGVIKDNLIINGNNLLALHTIKNEFKGNVKLIYVDPPYNTKISFTYNNNFKNSTWLTFMKNRLDIAKEFLREDGFVAITIDDSQLFYIGALADEIFGRENRIGLVTIVINPMGRQREKFFSDTTEYMLVYAKNKDVAEFNKVVLTESKKEEFKYRDEKGDFKLMPYLHDHKKGLRENKPNNWYPLYVSCDLTEISLEEKENFIKLMPISKRGVERSWQRTKDKTEIAINEGELVADRDNDGIINIYYKYREGERIFDYWDIRDDIISTSWDEKKYNANHHGKRYLQKMVPDGEVSFPKSIFAVMDVIKLTTSHDDIILDFFAGSGTTGEAVLNMNDEDRGNRQFILIEQLNEHVYVANQRVSKATENVRRSKNIIYFALAKYNQKAIDLVQKCKNYDEIWSLWKKLCDEYFLGYNVEIKEFEENQDLFKELSLKEQKEILVEMLNKNNLYINLSDIDDVDYGISEDIKLINKDFYSDYNGF